MKPTAVWLAAALALTACTPTPDERAAAQLTQLAQAALARPDRVVALRELDAVAWQRAEVFGPYTPEPSLPEKLKRDPRVSTIGISGRDDVVMLVLWDAQQQPAAVFAFPRGTADLSAIAGQPFYRTDCFMLGTGQPPQPSLQANC